MKFYKDSFMYTLHALHGFLGKPNDWNFLNLPYIRSHDLLQIGKPGVHQDLWSWAKAFNNVIENSQSSTPRILLAYSMGGRLALHALLSQPALWDGAIIVSAHPRFPPSLNKSERLQSDLQWAERFLNEPWDTLMASWNDNEVFSRGAPAFERQERDYSRKQLADMMYYWTVAKQEDITERLSQVNVPILWVAGENDSRYATQAKVLELKHPASQIWIAPKSGHRVPWEYPELFKQKLEEFTQSLLLKSKKIKMETILK